MWVVFQEFDKSSMAFILEEPKLISNNWVELFKSEDHTKALNWCLEYNKSNPPVKPKYIIDISKIMEKK